ncbi:MAG: ATP-binding protein [Thermobispora bispora]|nr:ATP-binding protein [Thermobispora bispora]
MTTGGYGASVRPRSDARYGTWRREFPGADRSVAAAREWARGLLAGQVSASVLDDVLLLSEVVTNAVAHTDSGRAADGRVVVWLVRTPTAVHVEVVDGGSATSTPAMRVPDADDDGGRGLWLVDLLAAAWGAHQDDAGGSVWFRVAVHA